MSANDRRPTVGEYCRAVEAHLCRRNGGHLVRVVGPAFEMVRGWEARGIPLSIALRGMDRYFDRLATRGPRRRPARVEFCEADVLDLFDEWRRAVGVAVASAVAGGTPHAGDEGEAAVPPGEGEAPGEGGAKPRATRRGPSLAAHLERVLTRLTSLLATTELEPRLHAVATSVLHEIGDLRTGARGLRGEARTHVLERLASLDAELMQAAIASLDAGALEAIEASCRRDLAPFAARMPEEALAEAMRTARVHAARERLGLPRVAMEQA